MEALGMFLKGLEIKTLKTQEKDIRYILEGIDFKSFKDRIEYQKSKKIQFE